MLTSFLLVIAGVVISMVLGMFWYSPSSPMGRIHMRSMGFDKLSPEEKIQKMEASKPKMFKLYGAQMFLSLLVSFATVFIITMSVQNGVPFYMAFGFMMFNWLCFMVPVAGGQVLWGNLDSELAWKKFFSDIANYLVLILLIATLTSLFV